MWSIRASGAVLWGASLPRSRPASSSSTAVRFKFLPWAASRRLIWPPQQKSSLRRRNTAVAPGNCTAIWPNAWSARLALSSCSMDSIWVVIGVSFEDSYDVNILSDKMHDLFIFQYPDSFQGYTVLGMKLHQGTSDETHQLDRLQPARAHVLRSQPGARAARDHYRNCRCARHFTQSPDQNRGGAIRSGSIGNHPRSRRRLALAQTGKRHRAGRGGAKHRNRLHDGGV